MTPLRKLHLLNLILVICGLAYPAWASSASISRVFTMTNAATGNEILIFDHHPGRGPTQVDSVASGGNGTDVGLGNQSGLVLSHNHRWLYAVNAGSDSISVFRVRKGGLTLVDTVASGGEQPVSLTRHKNLLYPKKSSCSLPEVG